MKNFLDVQRYALPAGTYELELSLKDRASNKDALVTVVGFTIDFPEDKMGFSDIVFLQSYEKTSNTSELI